MNDAIRFYQAAMQRQKELRTGGGYAISGFSEHEISAKPDEPVSSQPETTNAAEIASRDGKAALSEDGNIRALMPIGNAKPGDVLFTLPECYWPQKPEPIELCNSWQSWQTPGVGYWKDDSGMVHARGYGASSSLNPVPCYSEEFPGRVSEHSDFVSNTRPCDLETYKAAAQRAGLELYTADDAVDVYGRSIPEYVAVYIKNRPHDLSDYWREFRAIEAEAGGV